MSTAPRLLTVILNYRTAPMTLKAAAAALRAMEGIAGGIVILDNGSGDGSLQHLQEAVAARGWDAGGRVRVLHSAHNGGFGAGCNLAMAAGLPDGTVPDYIYLLNSDAFPEPDAIARLLAHMQAHPRCGVAGSYIHGSDGAPHRTAFRFPTLWSELEGAARIGPVSRLLRRHVVALPVPRETAAVDWVAGASMMLRRAMLDRIGGFDETFFLYFEETELCHRAQAAGWQVDYLRDSRVMHIGSVSTGMKTWARVPGYWFDSRWHYFTKVHGRAYAGAATALHVLGALLWRLRQAVQRQPGGDPPHFLRDLIRHSIGLYPAQKTPASHRAKAMRDPS